MPSVCSFRLSCVLLVLMAALASPVFAVDRVVNTVLDFSVPGFTSFRQAVSQAQDNDRIVFAVNGTIGLASTVEIYKNIEIVGNGRSLTRLSSANENSPILRVGSGRNVTIRNLSILDGFMLLDQGGGLQNNGNLEIVNCHVHDNSGGGVSNRNIGTGTATLVVRDSLFSGNRGTTGGAINNVASGTGTANTTIINSTFTGNSGTNGGALYCSIPDGANGLMQVINSTIAENTATGGAGIYVTGDSGPICRIVHSTISNNTASSSGGGVWLNSGQIDIYNSIIAANNGAADLFLPSNTTINLRGGNLVGTRSSGGTLTSESTDFTGITDPGLSSLANNGGPNRTMALTETSLAIDNGKIASLSTTLMAGSAPYTDQRGFARVNGLGVDSGAVEFGDGSQTLIVTTLAESLEEQTEPRILNIREALRHSNPDAMVDLTGLNGTIALTSQLWIEENTTIIGPGADILTLDGQETTGIFYIIGASATMEGLRIKSGFASSGAGISVPSTGATIPPVLNLRDLEFTQNVSQIGGALSIGQGTVNIERCLFAFNGATGPNNQNFDYPGGAIYSIKPLNISNSTFISNEASKGGAIYALGTLTLRNSSIISNYARDTATGGIDARSTTVMTNCVLWDNSAETEDLSSQFSGTASTAIGNFVSYAHPSTGIVDGVNDNQVGSSIQSPLDPMLGPLADNGGTTRTRVPMPGSPLINRGRTSESAGSTDQRGAARVLATVDIGAVEVIPEPIMVDDPDDSPTEGLITLREAVGAIYGSGTIEFSNDLSYPLQIDLVQGEIPVRKQMSIIGPGARMLTLSGGGNGRIFGLEEAEGILLEGMHLTDGSEENGGALRVASGGNTTLRHVRISDSEASKEGGAVWIGSGAALRIESCLIDNNTADTGGGIYNEGSVRVVNSTLSGNTGNDDGGAAYLNGGTDLFVNTTVTGNSSGEGSGALHSAGQAELGNTLVAANTGNLDVHGDFLSLGANLIGSADGSTGLGVNGDITGDAGNPVDALLGPLANNGGETDTHGFPPTSPAHNAGSNSFIDITYFPLGPPYLDQRGSGRLQNFTVDIGAFEIPADPSAEIWNVF